MLPITWNLAIHAEMHRSPRADKRDRYKLVYKNQDKIFFFFSRFSDHYHHGGSVTGHLRSFLLRELHEGRHRTLGLVGVLLGPLDPLRGLRGALSSLLRRLFLMFASQR